MQSNLAHPQNDDAPQDDAERDTLRRIRARARIALERNELAPDLEAVVDSLAEIETLAAEALR